MAGPPTAGKADGTIRRPAPSAPATPRRGRIHPSTDRRDCRSKRIDGDGRFEMAKLVLGQGVSNETIIRFALKRMDVWDNSYSVWDPVTDGEPPGKLERIRKTLQGKYDDAVSLFRIEVR